jgi:uncharacterized metal-binding protein YceD (DUF177 family)
MTDADTPEFSVPVEADAIPPAGLRETVTADGEARAALVRRFGLLGLDRLEGRFHLRLLAGGPMVRVEGRIEADLQQACVLTGVALPASVSADVVMDFVPPGMEERNLELTLEDADPPEPMQDGAIDLGELAAQQMVLALDPYPRAAEADLDEVLKDLPEGRRAAIGSDTAEARENPFAKLAALKGGEKP